MGMSALFIFCYLSLQSAGLKKSPVKNWQKLVEPDGCNFRKPVDFDRFLTKTNGSLGSGFCLATDFFPAMRRLIRVLFNYPCQHLNQHTCTSSPIHFTGRFISW
jgi:hypothetical protein